MLHNIVSYRLIEEDTTQTSNTINDEFIEDKKKMDGQHNVNQLIKTADFSPKAFSRTKACNNSTRVMAKRSSKALLK